MLKHMRVILAGPALAIAILACSMGARPAAAPSSQAPTAAPATGAPSPVPTSSPTPADTGAATATISPMLTSVPGIASTLTAVFSTPGVESTLAAQQTMAAGTQAALAPQVSGTFLSQCPHPSDAPMQEWQSIPVMPQATAGQIVSTLVGPYYCYRAPVTVQEMETFYKGKLAAPDWLLESDVSGTMEFVGISQAGMQFLVITSGPGDKGELLVAINVTRPVGIPTP